MNKKIEPKTIVKSYDADDLNQQYFEQVKYKCKSIEDNEYIKDILDLMRTTKSITLVLFEDVLPIEIFDELKWLKYFHFNAHITVQSEQLLSKYSECSKNITLNSKLDKNLIILRKEDQEEIYLFEKSIKNAYMLIQNIEQLEVHPQFKESLKRSLIITSKTKSSIANVKAFKDLKFGQIHLVDKYDITTVFNQKDMIVLTDDIEHSQNEYLVINDYIYQIVKVKNRIMIAEVYTVDEYLTFYRQTTEKLEDSYVVKDKAFCKLIFGSKDIDIIEDKLTIEEYENGESTTDLSLYKKQFSQYTSLNFHIKINPPYLKRFPEYKLASAYNEVSILFDDLKDKIKHDSELVNKSFPVTKVFKKYSEIFLGVIKKNNTASLLSMFRNVINEYPDQESLASEFRSLYTEDILSYIRKETIVVNHMISKEEANISNYDWFMNNSDHHSNASTSSLSRILNLPEDEVRLNAFKKHLLNMIYIMLDYYRMITSSMHKVSSFDLPHIGVLYELKDSKLLVIEYENEIYEAKDYASKNGASICVKGEITQ